MGPNQSKIERTIEDTNHEHTFQHEHNDQCNAYVCLLAEGDVDSDWSFQCMMFNKASSSMLHAGLPKVEIEYRTGNLLAGIPDTAMIVHACNCRGIWGAGVAAQLEKQYPHAFKAHQEYCHQEDNDDLGRSMAIFHPGPTIGCLFTRAGYGKITEREEKIGYEKAVLQATETAMTSMLEGMSKQLQSGDLRFKNITEIRMPMINNGHFGIEWDKTAKVLTGITMPAPLQHLNPIIVYRFEPTLPIAIPGREGAPENMLLAGQQDP